MEILEDLKIYAKDLSILIVEDDIEIQVQVEQICQMFFKHVAVANDGALGLEAFRAHQYDIVSTDINMPNKNGVEMAREIRHISKDQAILVFSAHSDVEYFIDLIDIGINQFVLKPFNHEKFLYRLYKCCEDVVNRRYLEKLKQSIAYNNISSKVNTTQKAPNPKAPEVIQKKKIAKIKAVDTQLEEIITNVQTVHQSTSANSFYEHLKNDAASWEAFMGESEELMFINSDLTDYVADSMLNGYTTDLLNDIADSLARLYSIFMLTDQLDGISKSIDKLSRFLRGIDVGQLSSDQLIALDVIEQFCNDISSFLDNVFVSGTANDINYLTDSFSASVDQFEYELYPPEEDDDDDDIEFF
jgi:DNA-binding response OmpR family regulator